MMTRPQQIPLDLGFRPALGREDFFVAPGNAQAVTWVDRWPAWPAHALAIFGPAGCGKSHLAQVFAARSGAVVVSTTSLDEVRVGNLLASHKSVVIEHDDVVFDEAALFHLFNGLKAAGGWLLLTGREAPARWPVTLPDLKSRLTAVQAVRIEPPDDETMQAVLVKLFADRQIAVAPDVVAYLAKHMERTFAAARHMVEVSDREALAGQRSITVPLVKKILEA